MGKKDGAEPPPAILTDVNRRFLLEGRTRVDRIAAELVKQSGALALPRRWDSVKSWEMLERAKVEALGPDSPLVERKYEPGFAGQMQEVLYLNAKGRNVLLAEIGDRHFVRTLAGRDGVTREYLIRRVQLAGGGHLETRLSWYGLAGPLAESWRAKQGAELNKARQWYRGTLFADLEDEPRRRINERLRLLGHIRDAQAVMDLILRRFGQDGRWPVTIPAWEFYSLLKCEADAHRLQRVRGCLEALRHLDFNLEAKRGNRRLEFAGAFLGGWEYKAAGPGGHGDGDFTLDLSLRAIGCLAAFQIPPGKAVAEGTAVFQWDRRLSRDDKRKLSGSGYIQGWTANLPHYYTARDLTENQRRLVAWLEGEITLNKDGARADRKNLRYKSDARGANAPRIYRRDFCPLLEEGRDYYAALGHFRQNPESGRRMASSGGTRPSGKSGGHPEGLLAVMGYSLSPGAAADKVNPETVKKAMLDLRLVVEQELGGKVAVFHDGRWFDLEGAAALHVRELTRKARWFLFVASDWVERIGDRIEEIHAARHAQGETPYEVRVTGDPQMKRAAESQRRGSVAALPARARAEEQGVPDEVGLDGAELRVRLHAGRKRAGLTVREAAAALKVSRQTISDWERGPDHGGKSIPRARAPQIDAWLESIGGPGPWNRAKG